MNLEELGCLHQAVEAAFGALAEEVGTTDEGELARSGLLPFAVAQKLVKAGHLLNEVWVDLEELMFVELEKQKNLEYWVKYEKEGREAHEMRLVERDREATLVNPED